MQIMDLIPDKPKVEHWTPISLSNSQVTLCQLDFKSYSAQPYTYPMFKDLLALSKCDLPGYTKRATIKELLTDIQLAAGTKRGRVVYPSGFVFHESRVGSTLIANMLASDADNMVFSEVSDHTHGLLLSVCACLSATSVLYVNVNYYPLSSLLNIHSFHVMYLLQLI